MSKPRDVAQVVRAAQQSGTPIYSIKVGYLQHSRTFFLTHPESRLHDVEKICRQTGGEMIDTRNGISVTAAMETILTWLKQGYTLGYSPTNKRRDGTYRTIEVRLNDRGEARAHKYTIYARQGYYATASASKTRCLLWAPLSYRTFIAILSADRFTLYPLPVGLYPLPFTR